MNRHAAKVLVHGRHQADDLKLATLSQHMERPCAVLPTTPAQQDLRQSHRFSAYRNLETRASLDPYVRDTPRAASSVSAPKERPSQDRREGLSFDLLHACSSGYCPPETTGVPRPVSCRIK